MTRSFALAAAVSLTFAWGCSGLAFDPQERFLKGSEPGLGFPGSPGSTNTPGSPEAPGSPTDPVIPAPDVGDDPCGPSTGAKISVVAGSDLQGALDDAQPGDTLLLEAGAVFTGHFTLPKKTGDGCITVRTATPDASLPAAGQRLTPDFAPLLPKLVTDDTVPALSTEQGAHHYRLLGLEITQSSGDVFGLVYLGRGDETDLAQLPHHLVLERVYVHGTDTSSTKRGVQLNSAATWVRDSTISNCKGHGQDTQAIAGWNGPGPYWIDNNYLEGAGENLLFGGADPRIANLVPSDIVISRNHFYKQPSWRGQWLVKNILELKNARRVTIDGNLLEYNWVDAQVGIAVLFTVRNQEHTAPWSVVENVTFTHNVLRHTSSALNITGEDDLAPSQRTQHILVRDNLFEDISYNWGGSGDFLTVQHGPIDLRVEHNTAFQSRNIISAEAQDASGFRFTDNITANLGYGVHVPDAVISEAFPGGVISNNVFAGTPLSPDPAQDNVRLPDFSSVGFVDQDGGDYHLRASSPFAGAATDGKDIGVDWTSGPLP